MAEIPDGGDAALSNGGGVAAHTWRVVPVRFDRCRAGAEPAKFQQDLAFGQRNGYLRQQRITGKTIYYDRYT